MKRVKLTVAYDGTNYCGWQTQSNGVAVQDVLNQHLSELLGEPIETIGASRTDAGVHALGNVAVFDTAHRMPAEKISYALNTRLPEDIKIQKSEEVDGDFHPRYVSSVKTYEYKILNCQMPIPTLRNYAHFTYVPLDVDKMRQGAQYLIGEHDFKSFCGTGAQVKTTVRHVLDIQFAKDGNLITMSIKGKGFLYNMVRIIAGTLMEVGRGKYPPEYVAEILAAYDRVIAGPTAPARGLTLVGIAYENPHESISENPHETAHEIVSGTVL